MPIRGKNPELVKAIKKAGEEGLFKFGFQSQNRKKNEEYRELAERYGMLTGAGVRKGVKNAYAEEQEAWEGAGFRFDFSEKDQKWHMSKISLKREEAEVTEAIARIAASPGFLALKKKMDDKQPVSEIDKAAYRRYYNAKKHGVLPIRDGERAAFAPAGLHFVEQADAAGKVKHFLRRRPAAGDGGGAGQASGVSVLETAGAGSSRLPADAGSRSLADPAAGAGSSAAGLGGGYGRQSSGLFSAVPAGGGLHHPAVPGRPGAAPAPVSPAAGHVPYGPSGPAGSVFAPSRYVPGAGPAADTGPGMVSSHTATLPAVAPAPLSAERVWQEADAHGWLTMPVLADGDSLFAALAYAHENPPPYEAPPSGQHLRNLAAESFNWNKATFMEDGTFRDTVLEHYAAYRGMSPAQLESALGTALDFHATNWAYKCLSDSGYSGPIITDIGPAIVGFLLGVNVQVIPSFTWHPRRPQYTFTSGNGTIAHGTRTLSVVHNQHHNQWRPTFPEA
jgi:hypothetical protein